MRTALLIVGDLTLAGLLVLLAFAIVGERRRRREERELERERLRQERRRQ